jgi:glutamyl-tRNA synthetase
MRRTRLAPSPTGALHLGNGRSFLVNWLLARRLGWKVILRVEDLDSPRVKAGADLQAVDDLRWLGLDWDEGPIYQSARMSAYAGAIRRLVDQGTAYPCVCSRREVEAAASAPHAEDGAAVYPGTCRGRFASIDEARRAAGREPALRFAAPHGEPGVVEFTDEFSGPHRFDVPRQLGDFVIAKVDRPRGATRREGEAFTDWTPAYQLAVVVDDAEMGVTEVVRGDDLLDSTPRQVLLYRALGMAERVPRYYHLPLVTGPDGRRLAKRHGDTRLSHYRQRGVTVGRVLALLARWCGMELQREPRTAADLLDRFTLDAVPRRPVVMSPDDDAWLTSGSRI